jgi:hypothetical protein
VVINPDVIIEVYDNLFYDINNPIRVHQMEEYREAYIYLNRFWGPGNVGKGIFWHWTTGVTEVKEQSKVWVYHNSFAGGLACLVFSSLLEEEGDGLPENRFVNNIFSCPEIWHYPPDNIPIFDYNWITGIDLYEEEKHLLDNYSNNIRKTGEGEFMWDNSKMPDFKLPEGSDAKEAGIDLSAKFNINGTDYDPLPGMSPGYFSGTKPSMGAIP